MTIAALLQLASVTTQAAALMTELMTKCVREGRDPTEAEIRAIRARQLSSETEWARLAPKGTP